MRGPLQVMKKLWTEDEMSEVRYTYQYVLYVRNHLEETCRLARESLYKARGQKVLPTEHNKLILENQIMEKIWMTPTY